MQPNSNSPASCSNSSDVLPQEIRDLLQVVSELPPDVSQRLGPVVDRVVESTRRRKRILSLVQEALSQLRLDTKYLMFDLESTRRERDELQAELDCREEE